MLLLLCLPPGLDWFSHRENSKQNEIYQQNLCENTRSAHQSEMSVDWFDKIKTRRIDCTFSMEQLELAHVLICPHLGFTPNKSMATECCM